MKFNYYTYIFVRQDMTNEYQLVQSAHVAMQLGNKMKNVDDIYFAVIGVKDLKEMSKVTKLLFKMGVKYETFYEPDIGNVMTAIATYPIRSDKRGELLKFKKLVFK